MKNSRIVFATGNEGKMREIRMILEDLNLPILSLKEAGVSADIVEDGLTFEENAVIKAEAIAGSFRRISFWQMTRDLRSTISTKSRGSIPRAIWEKILPMILRMPG